MVCFKNNVWKLFLLKARNKLWVLRETWININTLAQQSKNNCKEIIAREVVIWGACSIWSLLHGYSKSGQQGKLLTGKPMTKSHVQEMPSGKYVCAYVPLSGFPSFLAITNTLSLNTFPLGLLHFSYLIIYVLISTGIKNMRHINTEYGNKPEQSQENSKLDVYKPISL